MSPMYLVVAAILVVSGVAIQIWSSGPARAGRQYSLQLPAVLLYSMTAALFLFSIFPDSMAEGRALGFGISGAAGFAAFFMLASFAWLKATRRRDELAAQVRKVERENASLRKQLEVKQTLEASPTPVARCLRYEFPLRGDRRRRIGVVTGNIANVLGVDVWVNPENTRMEMSRIDEPTISAAIRYHGGQKDEVGHLVHDAVALELAQLMMGRTHVAPGQVLVTGAGELNETHQVQRILHVASVEGEPGSGYRQVQDLGRCVRNILSEMDRLSMDGDNLRSVILPLLGTGGGNSDARRTVEGILAAALDYFRSHPASRIRVVYLLAYTDAHAALCDAALDAEPELESNHSPAV